MSFVTLTIDIGVEVKFSVCRLKLNYLFSLGKYEVFWSIMQAGCHLPFSLCPTEILSDWGEK